MPLFVYYVLMNVNLDTTMYVPKFCFPQVRNQTRATTTNAPLSERNYANEFREKILLKTHILLDTIILRFP